MKKLMLFTMICSLALLSACGEKVESDATSEITDVESDITETTDDSSYEEDEVVEDDEVDNSSDKDVNTDTSESKGDSDFVYMANCPYVPTSEFWVSDTEFDLIGWFEANGAQAISFYDLSGSTIERDDYDNVYAVRALYCFDKGLSWGIALSDVNAIMIFVGAGTGDRLCDCTCEHGDYVVHTTGYSKLTMVPALIEKFDFVMKAIKDNPYSSDPIGQADGWEY